MVDVKNLKKGQEIILKSSTNGARVGKYKITMEYNQQNGAARGIHSESKNEYWIFLGDNIDLLNWKDNIEILQARKENLLKELNQIDLDIEKYAKFNSEEEFTAAKLIDILNTNNSDYSQEEKILKVAEILKGSSATNFI